MRFIDVMTMLLITYQSNRYFLYRFNQIKGSMSYFFLFLLLCLSRHYPAFSVLSCFSMPTHSTFDVVDPSRLWSASLRLVIVGFRTKIFLSRLFTFCLLVRPQNFHLNDVTCLTTSLTLFFLLFQSFLFRSYSHMFSIPLSIFLRAFTILSMLVLVNLHVCASYVVSGRTRRSDRHWAS